MVIDQHSVQHQIFVDNKQLYGSCTSNDTANLCRRLNCCVHDIAASCTSRRLQQNGDKSELIWLGTHANLQKPAERGMSIAIGSGSIQPDEMVPDLGVWLD
jgi:hypothetical protein